MPSLLPTGARPASILAAFLLLALPVIADQAPTITGRWEGAVEVPGSELAMAVDLVEDADGDWHGQIAIPPQNLRDFPLADVAVDGAKVHFIMEGVPGTPTFDGEVNAEGTTLAGTMSQGGQSFPFTFERTGATSYVPAPPVAVTEAIRDLAGTWTGALDVPQAPNGKLRMVLRVDTADDVLDARFGSPDQGNTELQVSDLTREGDDVHFTVKLVGGSWKGTLDPAGNVLDGTWSQGPQSLALVLTREDAKPE